jgi:hypothetical protein
MQKGSNSIDVFAGKENSLQINSVSSYQLNVREMGRMIMSTRFGNVQNVALPDLGGPEGSYEGMNFYFNVMPNALISLSTYGSGTAIRSGAGETILGSWGRATTTDMTPVLLTAGLWYVQWIYGVWRLFKLDTGADGVSIENAYGNWDRVVTLKQTQAMAPASTQYFQWQGHGDTAFFPPGTRDSYYAKIMVECHRRGQAKFCFTMHVWSVVRLPLHCHTGLMLH